MSRPVPPGNQTVPSIPLRDANVGKDGEPSIGNLVKDATASVSTLFRAEIALAKAELVDAGKKAGAGTGLFAVAGVMALYTSLFFFFFLAVLLDIWLSPWLAWLIVFLILLTITIVSALVGYIIFRKVRGPAKTIESVKEVQAVLPRAIPGKDDVPAVGTRNGYPPIPAAHDPRR
ncbi:phage holin family protein [Gordonia sp. (in: high G+C Gram-positive bacteria)]|uniref:phage holin family protein n=1 Tax=Gordonia sp. (in: high G+C Gram-positive bacteria) TaxID=84139 RepID=UPI001E003345|nr:phage holin family protein [Gordonia sp. (in: high G+C Gram-positive bacteria)]MCB1295707.1 phage holin family protein [Gordonia sp. (in: high G+C Gram-positive bacteria)]HMS77677.1 phage holin family protein [Gordonia sp. (in: high G+C Gram-positive bacteria)]HQV19407.1 phage holin family protein [Gordonia sp. (in: high G+C Gram-positive bacteria)]